jgi:Tfp pilus assembly ATPase PilU
VPGFDDPFDDLDQLVSELNLLEPAGARASTIDAGVIESWLGRVREADGSDLLLVAGAPPIVRAAGRLLRVSEELLSGEDIESAVLPLVAARLQERFRNGEAVDLAFT